MDGQRALTRPLPHPWNQMSIPERCVFLESLAADLLVSVVEKDLYSEDD